MMQAEDLARLIRESVDEQTARAYVPDGLAPRAMRAYRRRRHVIRAGGPAAVAAVVAAITIAATALTGGQPGHRPTRHSPAQTPAGTTTYARGDIVMYTATYAPWSVYPSRYFKRVMLDLGDRSVTMYDYLRGTQAQTVWTGVPAGPHHSKLEVLVDYKTRTWQRGRSVPGTANLPPVVAVKEFETGQTRSHCGAFIWFMPLTVTSGEIRHYVSCGGLRIAGHQRIDGTETIKVLPVLPQSGVSEALWISTSSHLPVQLAVRVRTYAFIADMTFLPPTKANLALLKPVIPSGFRRAQ